MVSDRRLMPEFWAILASTSRPPARSCVRLGQLRYLQTAALKRSSADLLSFQQSLTLTSGLQTAFASLVIIKCFNSNNNYYYCYISTTSVTITTRVMVITIILVRV